MKFSIIIPVKEVNDYLIENISYISSIDSNDWELIILPNEDEENKWGEKVKIIATGKVGPANKRDIGAKFARGEILVFFDDDSYPDINILCEANKIFKDQTIAAIGGPAITPNSDNFLQKVSGAVFLSKFSGGNPERYLPIGMIKQIDDWPSVNLMIRKKIFLEVGGFASPYWPGEDTHLCWRITKVFRKKMVYSPDVIVYHHRRGGLIRHLKQVGAYGLHRGYFAKKFPETSLRLKYFLPSAFFILVLITPFKSVIPDEFGMLIHIAWSIYSLAIIIALYQIYKFEKLSIALCAVPYIILTHIYYGYSFLRGLATTNLQSRLR